MTETNKLKELEGQPWSAWKKLLGSLPVDHGSSNKPTNKFPVNDTSSCMKLPRSDMPIFGLCPKTELFQLVVCNICGKKYKLPAFAEHMKLRHPNGESTPAPTKLEKSDKIVQKKGKLKKPKEKPKAKEKNEVLGKALVNEMKVEFMEIVSDRQSLPLESETVPKFKQINLKTIKKNQKSLENDCSKEDSNLSDKGNTCVSTNECVSDLSCKNSTDPVWPKAHVQLGNSSIVQVGLLAGEDGEVINMQPIVQLSPLSAGTSNTLTTINSNTPKTVDETNTNVNTSNDNQPVVSVFMKRTYNPDIHCGVLDKQNEKPCLQYLNCSIHSLSSKKIVNGRCKPFEILLNDQKHNNEPTPTSESSSTPSLANTNNCSPATSKPSSSKSQTSTVSANSRTEKTDPLEENEMKNKIAKRVISDRPRLSLPVSIKNPTILCQLQNKVLKSAKFSMPAESTRNENIQDLIKGTFVPKQVRNPRACRSYKENSRIQKKEGSGNTESTDSEKTTDPQEDRFEQWHPGFRRIGGLLYASHSIPYVNRRSVTPPVPTLPVEENSSSIVEQNFNITNEKNDVIDLCSPSVNKIDLTKPLFEIDCSAKKAVTSLPNKQKGHVLISANTSKSQGQKQKLFLSQSNNNNKTVICKRSNNNINGAIPAKIKKQEGLVNIVSPVFGKNDHALPVMHLEVANNVFDKQIITTNPHVPTPNSIGTSVQTGLNVIRGNSIRIGPPRIHYITASGPLPVSIQQVGNVQQLQLKPMRVQHKFQLVSPQVNITPSGVFYIQKTPTSSSSVNGVEER